MGLERFAPTGGNFGAGVIVFKINGVIVFKSKEWVMNGRCRRTGVAALFISFAVANLSGCLSMDGDPGVARSILSGPKATVVRAQAPTIVTTDHQRGVSYQDGVLDKDPPRMPVHPGLPGSPGNPVPGPGPMPIELQMRSHPPYTIAPPDIISIDAVRLIPKPPYKVEPLEVLFINVTDTLPNQPITGPYVVSPEGTINLGFNYGAVRVAGMSLDQIQTTIRTHLSNILRNAQVTVALAQFRGLQQIRGQHLVRPDGTISLGSYGSVYVAGMALGQAQAIIEKHLAEYLLNPQIAIDVFAYNSKVYYIILDGGGFGQQVIRLPITGNETVLDAIGQIQGLAPVSSKKRIWLARPSPVQLGTNQIMPIDWQAITMNGSTATNYQLFPGDRIYVSADCLITIDNYLSKLLAPVERVLGVTLLGTNVYQSLRNNNNNNGTAVLVP